MTTRVRTVLLAVATVVLLPVLARAQVHVRPYERSDGTHVRGHYRSAPNPSNNYTYPGNTNPYTGRVAPGNPDTYLRDEQPAMRLDRQYEHSR